MEFLVQSADEKHVTFLNAIIPSLLKQLGLSNNKKFLTVIIDDDLGTSEGITVPFDLESDDVDGFFVALAPACLYALGVALAHELVHVRQYARGFLKQLECGSYSWCGKKYGNDTDYLDLPWEIDAFSRQEILFRRAISV